MQLKKKRNHHTSLTHRTDSAPMFDYWFVISLHLALTYWSGGQFISNIWSQRYKLLQDNLKPVARDTNQINPHLK